MGKGIPIVFLHGGFGMDHSYFLPYVKPLAKNFKLVFFDFRGNGKSKSASIKTYTYRQFVEDVKELIKKLKLGKIYLLGHSAGGFIALKFALKYPKLLKGLILTDTFPGGPKPKKTKLPPKSNSNSDFKKTSIKNLLSTFRPKNRKRGRKLLERVIYRKDVFERLAKFEAPRYDVRNRLPRIKVSTLIMVGEKERPDPFLKGSRILAKKIPHSKLVVIKDSGHFPFIEKTKEFNKVIESFA